MKNYIKLIRVKHWLKNFLIFLPIFFSINILNKNLLLTTIIAFLSFSFTSSIVYIINDINDLENDKKHPIKKLRPLASGQISIKSAKIAILLLGIIQLFILFYLYRISNNIFSIIIPIFYLLINILYSKFLKNIPIIDVAVIVLGFLLRVIYGGVVVNIEVSKYLYLMIIFGSFYLAFGKRRNEIIKNGEKGRSVLKIYNKEFLDKNMYVAFSLAIVSYTLWCVDPSTIARIGNDYIFWTIPILIILMQLYSLNIEGNSHGDPIEVVLSDKKLLIGALIYAIILIIIIYVL